jgi:predicted PurR-regulated permease PerM
MNSTPKDPDKPGHYIKSAPVEVPTPPWSSTTKLVVALTLVALLAGLLITFRNIVGPLLLSFVLAYLLYPLAKGLTRRLSFSWRGAVNLIYLLVLIFLVGLLVSGGIALVDQFVSLIHFVDTRISALPDLIEQLTSMELRLGPFELSLQNLELEGLVSQILNGVQPLIGSLGGFVGAFATSAVSVLGWTLFVVLISYFILSESAGIPGRMIGLRIPGYQRDFDRMGRELGRIWNAFLRGQLIITTLTLVVYSILLGVLGVRFFYGLALLAALARFVPYVGPAITWATYGLVAYFQGYTIFGLAPFTYVVLVVGLALLIDTTIDNMIVPRILGDALRVHPAAVMIAALIAASLLGIIGIVLAAPVLASGKLVLEYAIAKLADTDPWEGIDETQPPPPMTFDLKLRFQQASQSIRAWFGRVQRK